MNFFNSNCPSLTTGFSFESNKKEIVQFLANPEVETDLKAEWSYIEKLLVRSKDNNVANKQTGGDADATKLRHLKRLQRLNEEPSILVKPPRSQKPSTKSSIPVTSVKLKKVNETGSMMSGNTSSRLSALQQYLTSISSKSGQLRQNQLRQNVNK